MHLPKIRVALIILGLITKASLARTNTETSNFKQSSSLIKSVAKIVGSCSKQEVSLIGIVGDSSGELVSLLSSEERLTFIILDNSSIITNGEPITIATRHKLVSFVITISSLKELEKILRMLKASRWWNHMAEFNIIEWPVNEHGCSEADDILWTAWLNNLLEVKFMCIHRTKGRLIYSFNPYTRKAPAPWRLERIFGGLNNHPWAFLVREYRDGDNLCDNLNYNKTNDLGGYEIGCAVEPADSESEIDNYESNAYHSDPPLEAEVSGMIRSLTRVLNAKVKLRIRKDYEPVGFYEKGHAYDFFSYTFYGASDIELIGRSPSMNTFFTYPHHKVGLHILTKYRGDKSQLSKIMSVLDIKSRIGVCIVGLITLIILKFFIGQSLATAVLNVVRVISSGSMMNLPKNGASRIYLSTLFMFVVTILGIYQGEFASILSKRQPMKNIDTLQDLVQSNHTVYSFGMWHAVFEYLDSVHRYVGLSNYNCTNYVLEEPSAACVMGQGAVLREAAKRNLYMSKKRILAADAAWNLRRDWPLERRINVHIQKLVEAGLMKYWTETSHEQLWRSFNANDNRNTDVTHKIFNLEDLGFAFAFLGIGLSCATMSFIAEWAINRPIFIRMGNFQMWKT